MIRFQAEQQRIRCSSTILFPTSKETCRVLPVAMSETDGCESPTNSPISCCVNPDRVSASISDLKSIDHIIGKPMSPVKGRMGENLDRASPYALCRAQSSIVGSEAANDAIARRGIDCSQYAAAIAANRAAGVALGNSLTSSPP